MDHCKHSILMSNSHDTDNSIGNYNKKMIVHRTLSSGDSQKDMASSASADIESAKSIDVEVWYGRPMVNSARPVERSSALAYHSAPYVDGTGTEGYCTDAGPSGQVGSSKSAKRYFRRFV